MKALSCSHEATRFTEERPAEIEEFWKECYPEIDTIPNNNNIKKNQKTWI